MSEVIYSEQERRFFELAAVQGERKRLGLDLVTGEPLTDREKFHEERHDTVRRLYVEAKEQRDLLGQALGELLVALGMTENVELTGPQLLFLAEEAAQNEFNKRIVE